MGLCRAAAVRFRGRSSPVGLLFVDTPHVGAVCCTQRFLVRCRRRESLRGLVLSICCCEGRALLILRLPYILWCVFPCPLQDSHLLPRLWVIFLLDFGWSWGCGRGSGYGAPDPLVSTRVRVRARELCRCLCKRFSRPAKRAAGFPLVDGGTARKYTEQPPFDLRECSSPPSPSSVVGMLPCANSGCGKQGERMPSRIFLQRQTAGNTLYVSRKGLLSCSWVMRGGRGLLVKTARNPHRVFFFESLKCMAT